MLFIGNSKHNQDFRRPTTIQIYEHQDLKHSITTEEQSPKSTKMQEFFNEDIRGQSIINPNQAFNIPIFTKIN